MGSKEFMASRNGGESCAATPIAALPPLKSLAALTSEPWVAHQGWADKWINLDDRKHPYWCEVTGPNLLSINGHFGIEVARLIAAAPDLLKALVAMEAEKADYMRINALGDPAEQHTNRMARAAIAKATGQGEVS